MIKKQTRYIFFQMESRTEIDEEETGEEVIMKIQQIIMPISTAKEYIMVKATHWK